METEYCDVCSRELTGESHYHCPNCLEECSMMGHLDEKLEGYSCKRNPRADTLVQEEDK
jgi:hypothetical protein